MRYMCFVRMREDRDHHAPPALFEAMDKEMSELAASGALISGGGLAPTRESTMVELRDGEIITTNGPWAEAKEVAGGYSIIEFRTHEDAVEGARRVIELHKEHWPGWEGACEVRRINE